MPYEGSMNIPFFSNEYATAYPTDRQAAIDKCERGVVGIMALCVDEVLDGLNSHGGASAGSCTQTGSHTGDSSRYRQMPSISIVTVSLPAKTVRSH